METWISTNGILILAGIAGATGLAGGLWIFFSQRERKAPVDLDRIVETAPYHRLDNILPARPSR